ncbi:GntR family transcriptional regulator [Phytohabitans rumicis]|uniref:GntR family transcriptional regulator n=1 Tax=Phytohabitans rumicis TaxID=1076125 RepID=UPI0031EA5B49
MSRTRSEEMHDRLRADILAGRFRPGERLKLAELQSRYGGGMGVIREALIRLAGQGLVRSEPQVGFAVVQVSREALQELTEARVAIEGLVLTRAIEHGDTRWEAQVVAAHHVLARTPLAPGSDEWSEAHLAFHRALLDGCPNSWLREIADSLRVSAELYRTWSQTIGREPDRDVTGEHDGLLTAVLARDAPAATRLLAAHLRRTAENLLAAVPSPE